MSDVHCPYCDEPQEICHDDGQGYAEDVRHEQECGYCGKTFVFGTWISFHYEASKADCLNGGEHRLKMSSTYPRDYSKMKCGDCDYERKPTVEEFAAAEIKLPTPKPSGNNP